MESLIKCYKSTYYKEAVEAGKNIWGRPWCDKCEFYEECLGKLGNPTTLEDVKQTVFKTSLFEDFRECEYRWIYHVCYVKKIQVQKNIDKEEMKLLESFSNLHAGHHFDKYSTYIIAKTLHREKGFSYDDIHVGSNRTPYDIYGGWFTKSPFVLPVEIGETTKIEKLLPLGNYQEVWLWDYGDFLLSFTKNIFYKNSDISLSNYQLKKCFPVLTMFLDSILFYDNLTELCKWKSYCKTCLAEDNLLRELYQSWGEKIIEKKKELTNKYHDLFMLRLDALENYYFSTEIQKECVWLDYLSKKMNQTASMSLREYLKNVRWVFNLT